MAPALTVSSRASGASSMSGMVRMTSSMRLKPAMAFWMFSVEFTSVSIGVVNRLMYRANVAMSTAVMWPSATSRPPTTMMTVKSTPVRAALVAW